MIRFESENLQKLTKDQLIWLITEYRNASWVIEETLVEENKSHISKEYALSQISTAQKDLVMNFWDENLAAATDKKKKLYGEDFWKLLEIVHETDLAAH